MENAENKDLDKKEGAQSEDLYHLGASKAGGIYCLSVIGQIEGHYLLPDAQKATKYEHLLPLLASIEQDPAIDGLLVMLNTVGGDVEAGLAIAELIASMKKPTASLVLGGGHSIGVPLAVSCKRSFIVPSATMTVHPVRVTGTVVGAPQTYDYFRKMQDRITRFVSDHSKITAERFEELLFETGEMATDVGTVLDGKAAVEEGLIGAVGGLSDALSALGTMKNAEKRANAQTRNAQTRINRTKRAQIVTENSLDKGKSV